MPDRQARQGYYHVKALDPYAIVLACSDSLYNRWQLICSLRY